jgi:ABC-type sugar transport system ATPase subunit
VTAGGRRPGLVAGPHDLCMTHIDASVISIRSVAKRYGAVHAVRDLALDISSGETVALLGPNGAGKSTTVGMLLGLIRPDSGAIEMCGRTPRRAVAEGRIAAMLQDAGMMPGVTVAELLGLGHRLYPAAPPVGEALELAGLAGLAKRRVDKLSGGQAQRLRFALAVVGNPEILVLDEPTNASPAYRWVECDDHIGVVVGRARPRRLRWRAHGPHALGREHRVKRPGELRVPTRSGT